MKLLDTLTLGWMAKGNDLALLVARIITGAFLIHGVWDNVSDAEQMREFAGFLAAHDFPSPGIAAPFSVYTQLLAGLLLIPGLLTRIAGLIILITFVVGYAMVHLDQSFREGWPALALVALGMLFATTGGGRYAIDDRLRSGRK